MLNRGITGFIFISVAALIILSVTAPCLSADQPQDKSDKKNASISKYIIKDGIPQGKLYLPANFAKPILFAAQELRGHLKKMSGADLEIAWREKWPGEKGKTYDGGFAFVIRPESEWKGKESSQAFTIEEVASPAPSVTITGNTGLAVLYGVYQYLNDLGVRWLAPGEIGTNIPLLADIPVRPGKRTCSPSFSSRILTLSSTPENHFGGTDIKAAIYDYQLYLIRNRTHFGDNRFPARDFGFNVSSAPSGGHAIKPMTGLTIEKVKNGLMEKEPERFSLVTGQDYVQKRRYDDGQVCFTNETNIKTAIESCISRYEELERTKNERNSDLDEDYTVSMALSDCFGICECANCAKVAGKDPNSKDRLVWSFWNRVAAGLKGKFPGGRIVVNSPYLDLTQPPDDVRIASNIIVNTPLVYSWEKAAENKDSYPFPKTFLEWVKKTRDAGATLACYNYTDFPWSPTPLNILDAAEGYAKLGYKYYHLEAMQRTEYVWPIIWSLAQFTWNSGKPAREYLKDFCREYYGSPYDADIIWFYDEMTKNACTMERMNFGGGADTAYMLTDELIKNSRTRLNTAVRNSQGKQQERLHRFSDSIEAQFQLAETYRAYCKALNSRAPEDIADFAKRANALREFWQKNNLNTITTTDRTPYVAAGLYLKTKFDSLKPSPRKELEGKGPQDDRWMKELFAGERVPENVPNLFPLPENWKFNIDYNNRGAGDGYFKTDYDDSKGWPLVSSWSCPSSQGYDSQVGGYFWYRVKFKAPAFPASKKVYLRIGSLDDTGDVYLNGVKVGSQPEPRAWDKSFVMDVTKVIKAGEDNVLAVHGYDSGGGEGVWRPSALYTE